MPSGLLRQIKIDYPMNREERGPWYLITALIIGVGAGLFYAWMLAPVTYIDIAPVSLQENYKEQYRALIAVAYAANNDLGRARSRLDQLQDPDIIRTLTMQAQRSLVISGQESLSHSLGMLALALENAPPARQPEEPDQIEEQSHKETNEAPAVSSLETAVLTTPTEIPAKTPSAFNISNTSTGGAAPTPTEIASLPTTTPLPARTPTPNLDASFVLSKEPSLICNPRQTRPLLIIEANDSSGNPAPGLQVLVQWPGGEDRFFTGLKPDQGLGYADFSMTPGISYTVQMADGGQLVQGITPSECIVYGSDNTYWGSWKISYEQR
jgi:hypothetical protein